MSIANKICGANRHFETFYVSLFSSTWFTRKSALFHRQTLKSKTKQNNETSAGCWTHSLNNKTKSWSGYYFSHHILLSLSVYVCVIWSLLWIYGPTFHPWGVTVVAHLSRMLGFYLQMFQVYLYVILLSDAFDSSSTMIWEWLFVMFCSSLDSWWPTCSTLALQRIGSL